MAREECIRQIQANDVEESKKEREHALMQAQAVGEGQ